MDNMRRPTLDETLERVREEQRIRREVERQEKEIKDKLYDRDGDGIPYGFDKDDNDRNVGITKYNNDELER